ncbi:MAG: MerR family transcriptional regulator, partial [Bacteroidota bacterium]|nr:MerR family transcriptional regulator [Bacteroidota bacterium]
MSVYSIADLEKLSGVKAHTIRIWEKRYNIVEPNRTDSNIRFYDDFQLKRILNISFLIRHGLKISKIAKLDNQDIELKVREKSVVSSDSELFINDIIVSTLTFDKDLFESTFARSLKVFGFDQMYESVLIPSL